jgi:hypothetical protein
MLAMKRFLLILLALLSANAFAVVNKWVDADGRVNYSDLPPPANVKAKPLHSASDASASASGVPAASAPAAPKTIAERAAELDKAKQAKQEAAAKAAQEQAAADAKKANCDAAQQNLRTLQAGTRIVEIDASGQRSYLDDAQRQQRIAKAQQDIATYCK